MALEVRPIVADELFDWVVAMGTAFHQNRPPGEEVAYRRDVVGQDYPRTLAALDGERIVGTYESFTAQLTLPGGATVASDAVSAVSVLPTYRRRGLFTRMLELDLRAARERGEVASILTPSEYPIYGRFGFGPATFSVEYTVDPSLARFTAAAEGRVDFVEPATMHALAPPLFDRFRLTRPGQIDRWPGHWETRLGLREVPWMPRDRVVRCVTYTSAAGELEGYLLYRVEPERQPHRPASELHVAELISLSRAAYLALWRLCCEMDLISTVTAGMRPPDEPLAWQLTNTRAAMQQTRRIDFLWLRPLDMPGFFGKRRFLIEERVVLEVDDPVGLCAGRFVLEGGPSGATCRATDEIAELRLGMTALGAVALGGTSWQALADAGLVDEEKPGALARAERMFHWPLAPWCSTGF